MDSDPKDVDSFWEALYVYKDDLFKEPNSDLQGEIISDLQTQLDLRDRRELKDFACKDKEIRGILNMFSTKVVSMSEKVSKFLGVLYR